MTLILEVVSPEPTAGGASRQTFHEEGGSIGRESGNSWVLPHPKVSGLHALITCRNNVYYIEDRSRNGICLNSSSNRLERGRPYPLESGDYIVIGPYEIRVSVPDAQGRRADAGADAGAVDLSRRRSAQIRGEASDVFDADDPFAPQPIESEGLRIPAEEIPGQPLDPLELLNLVPKRAPRKARSSSDLQLGSPLDGHYQPPSVVPDPVAGPPSSALAIPEDYDPLAPDDGPPPPPRQSPDRRADAPAARPFDEPRAEPEHAATARRPAPRDDPPPQAGRAAGRLSADVGGAADDLAAVLAGAGLDPADVTPEMARDFGQILRVVVSGVMDVMRSRQQIKDEFRMQVTRVRPAENNPLKFSAERRRRAAQPAREAQSPRTCRRWKRSRMHLPTCAITRSPCWPACGWRSSRCSPSSIRIVCSRSSIVRLSKGLVPGEAALLGSLSGKAPADRRRIPKATFRRLFGEEFARAYEDQLRQLKAQDRRAPDRRRDRRGHGD